MSCFPHDRLTAVLLDPGSQVASTLHIENNPSSRISGQYIGSEQHQLAIGIDNSTALGNHAHPITITVERKPYFRIGGFKGLDQVSQVFRHGGIGMMMGKGSVDFTKQFSDLASQSMVQAWRISAGDPVATVDNNLHRAHQLDVADDPLKVCFGNIMLLVIAIPVSEVIIFE